MSCQICTDKFNNTRKQVKCSCDYECCVSCTKTYILSKSQNAHCMNCNVAWNREFLVNNLGHTFIAKEYQAFRANILYERELNLLPEAQVFIEDEKRQIATREEIKTLTTRVTMLKRQKATREDIKTLTTRVTMLKRELFIMLHTNDATPTERKEFIRRCPNNECNGFLTKNLHCSLCGIDACGVCREIKIADTEHVCNEDVVKTVQLLQKDTKECPSCATLIFKISGCSQMFCMSCHKVFDWNTMKIDTGVVHNPHYFEWARQTGVNPRAVNVECVPHITHYSINTFDTKLYSINLESHVITKYRELLRKIIHIREVDMPVYRRGIHENIDLRVKFLKKEIDTEHFKTQLRIREKRKEKNTEIYNILDLYTRCVSDWVYVVNNIDVTILVFGKFKQDLETLTTYTQSHLLRISKVFKCKEYTL